MKDMPPLERISLGVRCDRTDQLLVPLPKGWVVPGATHGHGSTGNPTPCMGTASERFRDPSLAERVAASVEWDGRQVDCRSCQVKAGALCVHPDGRKMPRINHNIRNRDGEDKRCEFDNARFTKKEA